MSSNSAVFIASKWQRLLTAVLAVPDISRGRHAYQEAAPRVCLAKVTVAGTGDGAVDGDGDEDYKKRLFFISYMNKQVTFQLGALDHDLALLEDRPGDLTDASTEAQKSHHKACTKSNRLCLNFMRMAIANNIKCTLPGIENQNAKDFLKLIKEKVCSADKALTWTLMAELTTMKFDGLKSI
ncbi:hypothetical protein Tco_0335796 [Tanacetum coccineum]